MAFDAALSENANQELVQPLVTAYMSASVAMGEDEGWEPVADKDEWAAEDLYQKFVVAGYRAASKVTIEQASDECERLRAMLEARGINPDEALMLAIPGVGFVRHWPLRSYLRVHPEGPFEWRRP